MIELAKPSVSDALSFDEVIARLQTSPEIEGIAEFGSRAASQTDAASDYDLLLLVRSIPARVFQMVTSIDGRIADVVPVETETADALLAANEPPAPRSFEGLFAGKMKTARILFDRFGRLERVQAKAQSAAWNTQDNRTLSESDEYGAWFWQSFGLLHLERMATSNSPVHQTAVDMMLSANLPVTWRSYFDLRGLVWQGEKAAVRYWLQHDAAYLERVNRCLACDERGARVAAYRALVAATLAPVGKLFTKGDTAVMLADAADTPLNLQRVLAYWESLFEKRV